MKNPLEYYAEDSIVVEHIASSYLSQEHVIGKTVYEINLSSYQKFFFAKIICESYLSKYF